MRKFLRQFNLAEWLIWSLSVVAVIVCFFIFRNRQYHYLVGSIIGITGLVFTAKGNPVGQGILIVFSVFYGVISYSYRYYGEMLTFLCMNVPISVASLVIWLKHPYKGRQSQVKIGNIGKIDALILPLSSVAVTVAFYFILRALHTENLFFSTLSVLTSFASNYLALRRSRFYAIGFCCNDIVLIVLWSLASAKDPTYLAITICFCAFLLMDGYGFISWTRMKRRQAREDAGSQENIADK